VSPPTGNVTTTGALKCAGVSTNTVHQGISVLSPGTNISTVNVATQGFLYFVQIGNNDPNFNGTYLVAKKNTGPFHEPESYSITALLQASYLYLREFSISGNIASLKIQNTVGFTNYTSASVLITTLC
jgi:hypothetical protein